MDEFKSTGNWGPMEMTDRPRRPNRRAKAPVRGANMVAMPGSHRRTSRFDGEFKRAPKHTSDLEDAQNLGAGHGGDLRDAHGITQADTDLRRGETLLGELDDLLLDRVRLDAAPRRRGAAVRERRAGNALAARTT